MIDPLKKPTGSRWRNSWHRYAEFLRENGRRPVQARYKERSLYIWYSNNRYKLDNGLLYKELVPSFLKLTDEGDTYRFYVVNRETNIQELALLRSKNNTAASAGCFGAMRSSSMRERDIRDNRNICQTQTSNE